ncbi:MAG: SPASM domain-containing protein [Lachnospiraceae bacterium]
MVHRKNVDSMLETAKRMDSLGVREMRIIRTTEAPRWVQNAGDATLELTEYFDRMLQFVDEYRKADCEMAVTVWQFMAAYPRTKSYSISAVAYREEEYRDSIPVCKGNRGMIAVAANGQIYPCHQMSGYYDGHGWDLGNVKTGSLQKALQSGRYLSEICTTVKNLADKNDTCATCKFFKYCCGGRRAIGLALTGDKLGSDKSKCLFYEQGYYQKVTKTMGDWKNLTPIKEEVCRYE